ncbi:hypothetical protein LWH48_05710 [Halomonas sp. G15]|uniref:hypothetical protein n=1 Tax=Halomonas sp. G15 TaxID=2903521 RepID=UPI001E5B49C3|nr:MULTISPECIES: hypothetical protein [unclassified Halomonas]MCE0732298.1 hypothetical protein [Halomonas sp. G15]
MLEAAATAFDLLVPQTVIPRGEQAALFLPALQTGATSGLPVKERQQEPIHDWKRMVRVVNEAFTEARYNPETARPLFALAAYGKRDPDSLERLRAEFAQEGMPQEFLSHYEPDVPFACRKISDSLSSKF